MTTTRIERTLVVMVMFVLSGAAVAVAQDVDLTGTWLLDVSTSGGAGDVTLTLVQDGETLSGTYSSSQVGDTELRGTAACRSASRTAHTRTPKYPPAYQQASRVPAPGTYTPPSP